MCVFKWVKFSGIYFNLLPSPWSQRKATPKTSGVKRRSISLLLEQNVSLPLPQFSLSSLHCLLFQLPLFLSPSLVRFHVFLYLITSSSLFSFSKFRVILSFSCLVFGLEKEKMRKKKHYHYKSSLSLPLPASLHPFLSLSDFYTVLKGF